jgi:hypothetical protein
VADAFVADAELAEAELAEFRGRGSSSRRILPVTRSTMIEEVDRAGEAFAVGEGVEEGLVFRGLHRTD